LQRRLVEAGQDGVRVRKLGGTRAGEMRITRFLRNKRVSVQEIIETACADTFGRVSGRHILAIQDTTSLRDDGHGHSIIAHPTIAVDAHNGALLGLVHSDLIVRKGDLKASRKTRPFAERQSHRWLVGARHAASMSDAGAVGVTVVMDREGDIFDVFAAKPQGAELLVRASHNRRMGDGSKLFDCTQNVEEAGKMVVSLPAAPGRRARDITLGIAIAPVSLVRSGTSGAIDVHMIEAREILPPPGVKPAHWRLLTTHKVTSFKEARTIIGYYRERWTIEQLFRVLKTKGFDIEAVRISDEEPFQKLAAACLVAAVSVLQLVRDRDGLAKRPLEDVFDADDRPPLEAVSRQLEGKTERQKNPHPPGSLAFAGWVCARLGGWTGYYGKPGPVVMFNGLQTFKTIQTGWSIAKNV